MNLQISKKIFNESYFPLLLNYEKRYEIYYGGAGSGKSFFVAQKLILKALNSRRKILVARKVGKTVKQSVFQLLLDTLVDWHIADRCKINRSDFSIELPNGSLFLCTGVDDVEKLKSITGLTDAWLEEATEFNEDDFNQIDLRIRSPYADNQQIILSFNPVSKVNWCYKLFFEPNDSLAEFRKKILIHKSIFKDNKHLPQSYIDSLLLLKNTNPIYYSIYCLGEFGSLNKLVFNNWEVADFDYAAIDGTLICGLDFGYVNDPTAFIVALLDETNKTLYILHENYSKGILNDAIAEMIKDAGYAKEVIVADSAEPKSIEEIRRLGVPRIKPAVKGPDSINQGIQRLQQFHIVIHPDCKNLIEEFQNYSWQKDKQSGEYINKPIDMYNHGIDALRYSIQCLPHKLKTFSKKDLGL